jgi:hypothetical protein
VANANLGQRYAALNTNLDDTNMELQDLKMRTEGKSKGLRQ